MPASWTVTYESVWLHPASTRPSRRNRLQFWKKPYPHTSTFQQWYDWERFEAYRLLGYQLAKAYLPEEKNLEDSEFAK